MGTDNLFHKRRAKTQRDLQRQAAKKQPYERILVVCEGTATEVIYFRALIRKLRLHTANVAVIPAPSTCPMENFRHAREYLKTGEWDDIYCVFDKDKHKHYKSALNSIEQQKKGLIRADSIPCFEYWLLLHFEYSTASYYGRSKSPGKAAVGALKSKIPDYEKSYDGILDCTYDNISAAVVRAEDSIAAAEKARTDDPSTYVGRLVQRLLNLAESAKK